MRDNVCFSFFIDYFVFYRLLIRPPLIFLLRQIRSLNQHKPMITSKAIIITKTTITITTTTITVKARTMTTTTKIKRTIIALMKKQFTAKNYKYNWRKFERKNIQFS